MPAITLALAAVGDALAAVVAPEPHLFQPVDLVQLVTAIFSGVALLLNDGIRGIRRGHQTADQKDGKETLAKGRPISVVGERTVVDLKKNTDGLASRTAAMARKLGVQEGTSAGIAVEILTACFWPKASSRKRTGAALSGGEAPVVGAPPSGLVDKQGNPISVEDDRTAKASERVASATERVAVSTEKRTVLADQEKKP